MPRTSAAKPGPSDLSSTLSFSHNESTTIDAVQARVMNGSPWKIRGFGLVNVDGTLHAVSTAPCVLAPPPEASPAKPTDKHDNSGVEHAITAACLFYLQELQRECALSACFGAKNEPSASPL
jgi:hypothetical protein